MIINQSQLNSRVPAPTSTSILPIVAYDALPDIATVSVWETIAVNIAGGNVAMATPTGWKYLAPFKTTYAAKPAANAVPVGTELVVSDMQNQKLISDGTRWQYSQGRFSLFNKAGTITTPLASLTGVTEGLFNLGLELKIPAGLIVPNSKLVLQAEIRKATGTASASVLFDIGTTKTIGSDVRMTGFQLAVAANTDMAFTASARFGADKKSLTTRTWLGDGSTSGGSQNVFSEVLNHASLNTDTDMWISPRLSNANVADVFKFIGFGLWLES